MEVLGNETSSLKMANQPTHQTPPKVVQCPFRRSRTSKLIDRDRRALKRIAGRKHRTATTKFATAELNQHLNSSVSTKTVRHELNRAGDHERAANRKPLLSTINILKRVKWCRDHKGWAADPWKQVIFSDESSISIFPTAGRVYE